MIVRDTRPFRVEGPDFTAGVEVNENDIVTRTAPKLRGAGLPLAELVPGKFTELVRLPQTQALESFAGSGDAISQS